MSKQISFEASITLNISDEDFKALVDDFDGDEDEAVEEMRSDLEGENIDTLYGDSAFLAFVDEGFIL